MKIKTVLAAVVVIGVVIGAPIASAEDVTTVYIGQQAELVNGDIVQGWTISDLKPSSDVIPHHVAGKLWEATATDVAIRGTVTPIVSNLNARARNGDTYRVLFGVATPQGVNPATLAQGQSTTGKIYFDVTGAAPDSIFYAEGEGPPRALWLTPPPASPGSRGAATAPAPAAAAPATSVPEAPAAGSEGTPLPEGSTGTPLMPLVPPEGAGAPSSESTEGTASPGAQSEGSVGTPVQQQPTG